MNAWHLLRAVGRRPVVFTAAIPGPALDHAMYGKVSVFVAETESLASALRNAGVPGERLRVVHPGIDLRRFTPLASASGRFRVLFASTPASAADFEARGIPLMIEAARLCPEIDLYLPWRQWGNHGDAKRALAALNPPPNVLVEHRDIPDMSEVLQQSHATIWVAEPGHGKSCPNSVIEGLACGLPAVVSPSCGIADLITRRGAGIAPDREPQAIAAALRTFAQNAAAWRERARDTAVRFFSLEAFCGAYRELYAAARQQTPVKEGEDPIRAATADAAIATSRQDL
jgi:glycosyltransferase involved in cell wall biosynthesis